MKLHDQFKGFLDDHVNLNSTRLSLLEGSIVAVQKAVRGLAWGPKIVSFAPQGSWAHETIIKPQAGQPFDADLLVFVEAKAGWGPKDYVNVLATQLGNLPAYDGKVRRFSHCATIEYAGERKIDVAPCVMNRTYTGQYEVCNRIACLPRREYLLRHFDRSLEEFRPRPNQRIDIVEECFKCLALRIERGLTALGAQLCSPDLSGLLQVTREFSCNLQRLKKLSSRR